jgi:hypothetical protein
MSSRSLVSLTYTMRSLYLVKSLGRGIMSMECSVSLSSSERGHSFTVCACFFSFGSAGEDDEEEDEEEEAAEEEAASAECCARETFRSEEDDEEEEEGEEAAEEEAS